MASFYPFFVALHVMLCVFLIIIILLQPGKGGEMGSAFGGGGGGGGGAGSAMFGPRGPAGILQRATTAVAVLFMGTTIALALFSNKGTLANAHVDDEIERLRLLEEQRQQEQQLPLDPEDLELAPGLGTP